MAHRGPDRSRRRLQDLERSGYSFSQRIKEQAQNAAGELRHAQTALQGEAAARGIEYEVLGVQEAVGSPYRIGGPLAPAQESADEAEIADLLADSSPVIVGELEGMENLEHGRDLRKAGLPQLAHDLSRIHDPARSGEAPVRVTLGRHGSRRSKVNYTRSSRSRTIAAHLSGSGNRLTAKERLMPSGFILSLRA